MTDSPVEPLKLAKEVTANVALDGGTRRSCNNLDCDNDWPCQVHDEKGNLRVDLSSGGGNTTANQRGDGASDTSHPLEHNSNKSSSAPVEPLSAEPQEFGPITLDTNQLRHMFIDQDDKESPFCRRVILTPRQVEQVRNFIAKHYGAARGIASQPQLVQAIERVMRDGHRMWCGIKNFRSTCTCGIAEVRSALEVGAAQAKPAAVQSLQDMDDLQAALRELSTAMGNPAIEFEAGRIEAGLVRFAAQGVASDTKPATKRRLQMIPTVESVYCDNCQAVKPVRYDRMKADERNDHDATDVLCDDCCLIIATLHHPVGDPPATSTPGGER